MKLRFTVAQAEWLKNITGTETTQEALDFFIACMRKENIDVSEVMNCLEKLMSKKLLPPGSGDR